MLSSPPRKPQSLGVFWMAAALVLAAFLGAALGLVWQSAGFGEDEEEEAGEASTAAEDTSEVTD